MVTQLQAKSRMCLSPVPLGQKGFAGREGWARTPAVPSPKSTPALCQVCAKRQEEGCWGVRLSAGIGVHGLGPTPLKLLPEVSSDGASI